MFDCSDFVAVDDGKDIFSSRTRWFYISLERIHVIILRPRGVSHDAQRFRMSMFRTARGRGASAILRCALKVLSLS